MSPLAVFFAAACVVVGLWWVWLEWRHRQDVTEDLAQWRAMFSGRCPVCAWHRYGRHFGHETANTPAPHVCPEAAP